jgi:hypothetical protein
MIPKHSFSCKSAIAPMAPNTAHVFGHVGFERIFVRQDLVAETAGRVAQVNVIVRVAACSRAVRLVAHTANETPITFINRPRPSRRPSLDRLDPLIACKFQAAR